MVEKKKRNHGSSANLRRPVPRRLGFIDRLLLPVLISCYITHINDLSRDQVYPAARVAVSNGRNRNHERR
jgi:hypothetical protein